MTPPRLNRLRLSLERLAVAQLKASGMPCPPMQAFLAVPIRERLVLLARADGADEKTIQRLLRTTPEDAALQSQRMVEAVKLLTAAMDEPWGLVAPGWSLERLKSLYFYRRFPAMLVGEAVPAELATLSLQQRLGLYLILVEGASREEVQSYLGCTEHSIKRAIEYAQTAVRHL